MLGWERLGFNMVLLKILITFIVAILVLSLILQYLIKTNRLKPSRVSRLFCNDDVSFIKSWKKTKEKGMLRFTIKIIISYTIAWGIIGMFFILNKLSMFGYEQNQTIFVALIFGAITGLLISLMEWGIKSSRYRGLTEKVEDSN